MLPVRVNPEGAWTPFLGIASLPASWLLLA